MAHKPAARLAGIKLKPPGLFFYGKNMLSIVVGAIFYFGFLSYLEVQELVRQGTTALDNARGARSFSQPLLLPLSGGEKQQGVIEDTRGYEV